MRHTRSAAAPVWRASSFSGGENGSRAEVAFVAGVAGEFEQP